MNSPNESPISTKNMSIQRAFTQPTTISLLACLLLIAAYLIDGGLGGLALPVFIFYSVGYYRRKSKENPDMVLAAPLLLNIATILIVLFAPFRELRAELKFRLNKPEYEKIVKQIDEDIRSGKIKTLPAVYQYQSNSIESIIIYHKTKLDGYVIYFSNDVTFTSQSGLLYVSTDCDVDVAKCVSAPFGSFETIRYLEPNWYVFRLWILE